MMSRAYFTTQVDLICNECFVSQTKFYIVIGSNMCMFGAQEERDTEPEISALGVPMPRLPELLGLVYCNSIGRWCCPWHGV